jgi:hypothetical protein
MHCDFHDHIKLTHVYILSKKNLKNSDFRNFLVDLKEIEGPLECFNCLVVNN